MEEPKITSEEAELLSQKGDIQAKKDAGENLTDDEQSSLDEITTLEDDLKERFKEKDTPDDEKTTAKIQSLQAQKEHFRTKYGKSDTRVKELEIQIETLKKEKDPKGDDDKKDKLDKRIDGIEFLTANRDVTKTEFDFISAFARGKGSTLEEALESEDVKVWLDAHRAKVAKGKKTPSPTDRSRSFNTEETQFKSEDTDQERKTKHRKSVDEFLAKKKEKANI